VRDRAFTARVLCIRTLFSVARSEDQMTEVRWFLSIQFSKSLIPWRAIQSRAICAPCQELFASSFGAARAPLLTQGTDTIRNGTARVKPSMARIARNLKRPLNGRDRGPGRTHAERRRTPAPERRRKKEGGRVPRQGRHVLDGTLDRMEGASLRAPETLPPTIPPAYSLQR